MPVVCISLLALQARQVRCLPISPKARFCLLACLSVYEAVVMIYSIAYTEGRFFPKIKLHFAGKICSRSLTGLSQRSLASEFEQCRIIAFSP